MGYLYMYAYGGVFRWYCIDWILYSIVYIIDFTVYFRYDIVISLNIFPLGAGTRGF